MEAEQDAVASVTKRTLDSDQTEQASDPVGGVVRAPAKAAAPVIAQTTQTVSKQALLEPPLNTLQGTPLPELLSAAIRPVREVLDFVTASVTDPTSVVEGLLPPSLEPVGFGLPAFQNKAASFIDLQLVSPLAAERTIPSPEGNSLAEVLSASAGVEPQVLMPADGPASSPDLPSQAIQPAVDLHWSSVTDDLPSSSLPDRRPVAPPPLEAPGAAFSSGGTFFVPLAALLALLAFAAPATFRRRMEVPGFLAPIPFVCALERPG